MKFSKRSKNKRLYGVFTVLFAALAAFVLAGEVEKCPAAP